MSIVGLLSSVIHCTLDSTTSLIDVFAAGGIEPALPPSGAIGTRRRGPSSHTYR